MGVSDEDSEKPKLRQLLREQLNRKKRREKQQGVEDGELAKNFKSLRDGKEDQGESSTSSVATITGKRTARKNATKAREKRNASKSDYIGRFKEVTERLYEQVLKFSEATSSEVRSLLTVAKDYEKLMMELVRENARLSGRIEELEKAPKTHVLHITTKFLFGVWYGNIRRGPSEGDEGTPITAVSDR
uniref:Uncharacterized protein n=1 Tax=Glossina palpalis gambiensis TaxID=67801 RepID=A0A1B0C5Q8_9MUSC